MATANSNPLRAHIREDLPGRFNELDVLRRQWALYAATVDGTVLPPYEVLIHPSSGCNLRCAWCIGDHVPIELWDDELSVLDASKTAQERLPDHLLDPGNMLRLVQGIADYQVAAPYRQQGRVQTAEFKVHNISFSGLIGEPLVAKQAVITAMRFLVQRDIRVGLFTNGVLMDDEAASAILRTAYVHVSLDAATPETYTRLKFGGRRAGEAKFARAVANLKALVGRRSKDLSSTLAINASFIMWPENYHEVYQAARLLRDAGVDTMRLKQDNSGQRLLSPADRRLAQELIARIKQELVSDRFRLVEIHQLAHPSEMVRTCDTCSITNLMAAVGSDGHLYPCNYHPRPGGASYGSALEHGFQRVWEGQRRRELRRQLPHICPAVCDPFKNRANRLLAGANDVVATQGLDRLERHIEELAGFYASES